jgi:hypothetical protein
VFLSGQSVVQYQLSTGAQPAVVISASRARACSARRWRRRGCATDHRHRPSNFAADYARSWPLDHAPATVNSAFTQAIGHGRAAAPGLHQPADPAGGDQHAGAAAADRGADDRGQFDLGVRGRCSSSASAAGTPTTSRTPTQPNLLAKVAHALSYFDGALANIGGSTGAAR